MAWQRFSENGCVAKNFKPYKGPSETPFDDTDPVMAFLNEKRWANNQVHFIKSLLAELKWLARFLADKSAAIVAKTAFAV